MDHLPQLARAYRRHAPALRGQAAGLAMIMVPALTHPLPLSGVLHTVVQLLAVLVGAAGTVVVFGGLALRAFLDPRRASGGAGEGPAPATQNPATSGAAARDAVLLAVPHARIAWVCMVLVSVGLVAGAVWSLGLIFTRDLGDHLTDALMLALPAAALGWATWRARVMWTAPAW